MSRQVTSKLGQKKVIAIWMAAIGLLLCQCSVPTPDDYQDDRLLYEKAMGLYNKRQYGQAAEFFDSLRNRFPMSPHAIDSELFLAESYFNKGDWIEAELAYASFRTLHPSHDKVPYVTLQIAKTHLERMPRSPTKDQTHANQAVNLLSEILRSWPGTAESAEALPLLQKAQKKLVEKDLSVARYYFKKKKWRAALSRYREVSLQRSFPELWQDAQFHMALIYGELGQPEQALTALEPLLKQDEPSPSSYYKRAEALQSQMQRQNSLSEATNN